MTYRSPLGFVLVAWLTITPGAAFADDATQRALEVLASEADSPAARDAQKILDDLHAKAKRRRSRAARTELVVGQVFHGIGLGAEICVLADCRSGRAWAGATLAGTAVGLTASLAATRGEVRPGLATTLNVGTMWGAWSGYALFGATSRFYDAGSASRFGASLEQDTRRLVGGLIGGQLGGLALGLAVDRWLSPTPGQASAAFAAGTWAAGITSLLWVMKDDFNTKALHGGLFAVSQLGLVGGYMLAKHVNMSRGRVLLLHTGGIGGAGIAALGAFLIGDEGTSAEAFLGAAAAGAVVGLGLTYFLTRHFDAPDLPVDLSLSPTKGGAMASIRVELR